jgi:hypothetical protein
MELVRKELWKEERKTRGKGEISRGKKQGKEREKKEMEGSKKAFR